MGKNILINVDTELEMALNEMAEKEGIARSKVIDRLLKDGACGDRKPKVQDDQKYRQKMYNQAISTWDHLKPGWRFWPVEERDVPVEHSPERLCPECQAGGYHCHGKPNIFPARAPLPSRLMVRYRCQCWCAKAPAGTLEPLLDELTDNLNAQTETFPE